MTWAAVAGAGILTAGSLLGGSGGGGQSPAQVYQPTGQGGADTQLQGFFNNYQNPYGPASGYNTGYLNASQNNPYTSGYQTGANNASGIYGNLGYVEGGLGNQLYNTGSQGVSQASNLMGQLQNPYLSSVFSGAGAGGNALTQTGYNSLAASQALPGIAQNALGGLQGLAGGYAGGLNNFASSGAQNLQGLAQQTTSGLMPYAQASAASLPGLAQSYAAPGNAAASSILNTAFDPQGQLYNQQFQQNQDQTRASLAARGLNSSGTGAGIENQSNQNFNTNWQNQQLARQQAGLGAYDANSSQAYGQQSSAQSQGLSGLLSAASGTFSPYSTAYGQGVSGLNQAATTGYGIQSGAAGQYLSGMQNAYGQADALGTSAGQNLIAGGAAQANAFNTNLNNYINQLGNLGNVSTSYGNLSGLGDQFNQQSANSFLQQGQVPYQASQNILGNQFGGLQNYTNLAGQGQGFDQQMQGNLMQYLGLGTSAGQALSNTQNQQYNQNQNTYSNIGNGIGNFIGQYQNSTPYYSNMFSPSNTANYASNNNNLLSGLLS